MGTVASRLEQSRRVDSGIRESARKTGGQSAATHAVAPSPGSSGSALTVVVPIVPEREHELRKLLTRVGTAIDEAEEIRFDALETVHFLRWVILPPAEGSTHPLLAFESNYDGSLEAHLDDLYRNGATFLHAIYGCCVGYPLPTSGFDEVRARGLAKTFFMQHMLPYAAFHVGRRNKPVRQIRDEAAICVAVQEFLDALGPNPGRELGDPDAAYDVVVEHLARVKPEELHRLRTSPRTPPVRRVFPVAWRLLGLGVSVLPALPLFYAVLLYKEWTDREETYGTLPRHTRLLLEREDFQVQNQLTHLVEVKPGLFRQLTLRAVLWSIDTLARYYYNQGDLGGLSTIHYARWVLIDGGKRLLFFSNYDGSWERYLGDFIDQAHVGLTAVWSNTKGFPKTFSLIGRGAKDEERFKAWTRAHQIQSELWYSAYPSSTVPNIERNSAICDGIVTRPETRDARARWLSLL